MNAPDGKNEGRERFRRLAHLLAALVILLHGIAALDHHAHTAWIFFLCGTVFLLLALFHHRIERRWPYVSPTFHFLEAIVAAVIFTEYVHAGKKYLPYVAVLPVVLYTVLGIWRIMQVRKETTDH
jgi:phosphatidylserine synthase